MALDAGDARLRDGTFKVHLNAERSRQHDRREPRLAVASSKMIDRVMVGEARPIVFSRLASDTSMPPNLVFHL